MRILFLGNNWVAWQVAAWLKKQHDQIAGLVIHPPDKRKYVDELVDCVGVPQSCIFDGSRLRQPEVVEAITKLEADLALSVLFGYILQPEFIGLFPEGVVNLHPSFLPYNRGAYPNVWSIVDGTPAGATLHYIDPGIDTGDIINQRKVTIEPVDTGESLYRKLEKACVELFSETWPLIRNRKAPRTPQVISQGTYHRSEDVDRIDEIHLDRTYTARQLLDIVRARTYSPHGGAYFHADGRKVYIRSQLLYEEDLNKDIDAARD